MRSLEERVGQLEQALKNAGGVIPPSIPTSPQSPYATLPIKGIFDCRRMICIESDPFLIRRITQRLFTTRRNH